MNHLLFQFNWIRATCIRASLWVCTAGFVVSFVNQAVAQVPPMTTPMMVAAPVTTTGPCTPNPTSAPCQPCIRGVDCAQGGCGGPEATWCQAQPMDFGSLGPGEFVGPARWAALSQYRLRAGDELRLFYLRSRKVTEGPYRLQVGDTLLVDSLEEDLRLPSTTSVLTVQPDGTISLRLIGEVQAAGRTIEQLRAVLESRYRQYVKEPKIDVIPQKTNTRLSDINDAVGGQSGLNPPVVTTTIQVDGKVRLVGIGEVCCQGLSLNELKQEINLRYAGVVDGLEVEPTLQNQAPHFVIVTGEVNQAGRFQLQSPTTAIGALALAGGSRVGANLRQVVVMRRTEDWRLVATMLDLSGALWGKRPTPADEIWLRDGDIVIVPPMGIRRFDNIVRLYLTEGAYAIVPFGGISLQLGQGQQ